VTLFRQPTTITYKNKKFNDVRLHYTDPEFLRVLLETIKQPNKIPSITELVAILRSNGYEVTRIFLVEDLRTLRIKGITNMDVNTWRDKQISGNYSTVTIKKNAEGSEIKLD
jgi:hypothetical protein